ncbi:hypothetical protein [Phreatobacter stygius]|uniref:Uncharacterized protein n=1 Tax=Phreatobacter stygius TaxID=1940610 RepID=A0A4D7B2V4_9HYPH|nr:hypothetical protein [Phreatobacter stygius]QCI65625.1 hypothetical protein E8M01_16275 [Phreatobacter stygius]
MAGWIEHVTGPAERWDHLAYRYYGDANRFGPIIRENQHLFVGATSGGVASPVPTVLPDGQALRIPVLDPDPIATDLLPPWKRGDAA